MTPHNDVVVYQRFGGPCCLHLHDEMPSETFVSYHIATRCHNSDHNLNLCSLFNANKEPSNQPTGLGAFNLFDHTTHFSETLESTIHWYKQQQIDKRSVCQISLKSWVCFLLSHGRIHVTVTAIFKTKITFQILIYIK